MRAAGIEGAVFGASRFFAFAAAAAGVAGVAGRGGDRFRAGRIACPVRDDDARMACFEAAGPIARGRLPAFRGRCFGAVDVLAR